MPFINDGTSKYRPTLRHRTEEEIEKELSELEELANSFPETKKTRFNEDTKGEKTNEKKFQTRKP